jgi:3',5'-cyclic AMP phosphodiesterase CpdA
VARIAQLSDLHVMTGTDERARGVRDAVGRLGRLWPPPECVVITGDLTERGLPAEYELLRDLLAPVALPVYLIPGNHDDRAALRSVFAGADPVHGVACGPPAEPGAFVQYAVDLGPVRVVLHDSTDPGRGGGAACGERLAVLNALLSERPGAPTVLAMHHPPFLTRVPIIDAMTYEGLADLATVVEHHPQIARLICGHVHRPITTRFAGTIAVSCPSTWVQLAFGDPPAATPVIAEPPALALHLVEPDGGALTHLIPIGDYPPG